MTPAARVQAAIEILDLVVHAARTKGAPADRLIAEWFRNHRFAGSKDKRAIREHVYAAIRACGPVPKNGRAAMLCLAENDPDLALLFDGSNYGPAVISPDEQAAEGGIAPEWLEDRLIASDVPQVMAEALLGRAPLDLRVNNLKLTRDMVDIPVDKLFTAAPQGLRVPVGSPVESWDAYLAGEVEIQDSGSQLAALAAGAQPGETVIDLCAGAGGKTLALAAAMENRGTLIACDTDRGRLSRLPERAERAGVGIAETILLNPGREAEVLGQWLGKADVVLVDAPCSGTGTWRRNPEARWRLDEGELERLVQLQARLFALAATLVKPGGRICYVTCSLLDEEGAGQVETFLAAHPGWQAQPLELPAGTERGAGLRLDPYSDGTDGFFVALVTNAC